MLIFELLLFEHFHVLQMFVTLIGALIFFEIFAFLLTICWRMFVAG